MAMSKTVPRGMSCWILPHSLRKFGRLAERIHTMKCSSCNQLVLLSCKYHQGKISW